MGEGPRGIRSAFPISPGRYAQNMFSKEVIATVSNLLNLPTAGYEQDWPLELADAERIGEFVSAYERSDADSNEQKAIMALIVASVDDYCGVAGVTPPHWSRVVSLLERDAKSYGNLIAYWSCDGDEDPDLWFAVTPFIRRLRR